MKRLFTLSDIIIEGYGEMSVDGVADANMQVRVFKTKEEAIKDLNNLLNCYVKCGGKILYQDDGECGWDSVKDESGNELKTYYNTAVFQDGDCIRELSIKEVVWDDELNYWFG